MIAALYVFLGGGIGCLARYSISLFFPSSSSHYGTLVANICACFILGILLSMNSREVLTSHHKLLFATGFCGGFSTFSTFSGELILLSQEGAMNQAILYGVASIIAGILSILLGMWVGQLLSR